MNSETWWAIIIVAAGLIGVVTALALMHAHRRRERMEQGRIERIDPQQ